MLAIQNHKALWRKKRQWCDAKDVKGKPKTASHVEIAESKCRAKSYAENIKKNLRKAIIYDNKPLTLLHTSFCGGDCSLVDFWLFYFIFDWWTSTHQLSACYGFHTRELRASHGAATRLTALISGVPAVIGQEFMRKKIGSFFQPKLLE